jgi:hypothetical protein
MVLRTPALRTHGPISSAAVPESAYHRAPPPEPRVQPRPLLRAVLSCARARGMRPESPSGMDVLWTFHGPAADT